MRLGTLATNPETSLPILGKSDNYVISARLRSLLLFSSDGISNFIKEKSMDKLPSLNTEYCKTQVYGSIHPNGSFNLFPFPQLKVI